MTTASELIEAGNKHLAEKNYDAAIEAFDQAIHESSDSADLYTSRAKAHLKAENFLEAVADATKALELEPKSPTAHMVKGQALYNLDEFESAKEEFEAASVLEPTKQFYKQWINMCRTQLGEEMEPLTNKASLPSSQQEKTAADKNAKPAVAVSIDDPEYSKYWRAPVSPAAAIPQSEARYRHQWFQNDNKVEVNVLAKKVPKEQVTVNITAEQLVVIIRDAQGNEEYTLDVKLFAPVIPESSSCEVLSTKIEVKLDKADKGKQWGALDVASAASSSKEGVEPTAAAAAVVSSVPTVNPVYPYAGKKVDWEKVEKEVVKEEDEEQLEGDAAVMKLFKKLYADGNDEMRRAMMKSYQESGGTALSTNWKDVAKTDYKKEREEKEKKAAEA